MGYRITGCSCCGGGSGADKDCAPCEISDNLHLRLWCRSAVPVYTTVYDNTIPLTYDGLHNYSGTGNSSHSCVDPTGVPTWKGHTTLFSPHLTCPCSTTSPCDIYFYFGICAMGGCYGNKVSAILTYEISPPAAANSTNHIWRPTVLTQITSIPGLYPCSCFTCSPLYAWWTESTDTIPPDESWKCLLCPAPYSRLIFEVTD